jgi:hypothetical protein
MPKSKQTKENFHRNFCSEIKTFEELFKMKIIMNIYVTKKKKRKKKERDSNKKYHVY